jgi:predicted Zn-dependent protease
MLFVIIPLTIAVFGLMIAGRIIYKKIPEDTEIFNSEVSKEDFGPTFYKKALSAFSVKSKQAALKTSTKLIYKLKITSLKTDNFFSRLLQEMKSHKENMKIAESELNEEKDSEKPISFEVLPIVSDLSKIEKQIMQDEPAQREEFPKPKSRFEIHEQQLINQLAYNPKDVSAYKRIGWLYLENNKPVQARQAFKTAVKLGSKDKVLMTKLLEIGGVLHKEGIVHHIEHAEPVLAKAHPSKLKETKEHKPKVRKLKVRKG